MSAHGEKRDGALERLLGPAEYEVGCEECFARLDEFVELELAGLHPEARIPGLRVHLDGCPACRQEHDALCALLAAEFE